MKNEKKFLRGLLLILMILVIVAIVLPSRPLSDLLIVSVGIGMAINLIASLIFAMYVQEKILNIYKPVIYGISTDDARRIDKPNIIVKHFKPKEVDESYVEMMMGWIQNTNKSTVLLEKIVINNLDYLPDWGKIINVNETCRLILTSPIISQDEINGLLYLRDVENNQHLYTLNFVKLNGEYEVTSINAIRKFYSRKVH